MAVVVGRRLDALDCVPGHLTGLLRVQDQGSKLHDESSKRSPA